MVKPAFRPVKRRKLIVLSNRRHRIASGVEAGFLEYITKNAETVIDLKRQLETARSDLNMRNNQLMRMMSNDPTGALPEEDREKLIKRLIDVAATTFSERAAHQLATTLNGRYHPIKTEAKVSGFKSRAAKPQLRLRVTIPEIDLAIAAKLESN